VLDNAPRTDPWLSCARGLSRRAGDRPGVSRGFGANHNAVIRDTSGRYVYVLNEDTTADVWGFDALTAYLDAHPRVAALGPRLVYPDGRLQDSAWRFRLRS